MHVFFPYVVNNAGYIKRPGITCLGSVAADLGCYADNATSRDLSFGMNVDKWKSSPNEIPAQCQKLCKDNSYTYAGVQSAKVRPDPVSETL